MKPITKKLAAAGIAALSLFTIEQANAQRPHISIGFGFYPRVGYYYNPYGAYYGYAYPRIGLSFGYLPYGYVPFYFGPTLYYYSNGVYYRHYDDNSYHVVAPPVGAEVPQLPSRARAIMIDNQQYFELNGVYYKPNTRPDGTHNYIIAGKDGVLNTNVVPAPVPAPAPAVAPPPSQVMPPPSPEPPPVAPPANVSIKTGDTFNQLPDGCKVINVGGKKYFVSADDIYYEEVADKGKVSYRVAGTPADNH